MQYIKAYKFSYISPNWGCYGTPFFLCSSYPTIVVQYTQKTPGEIVQGGKDARICKKGFTLYYNSSILESERGNTK